MVETSVTDHLERWSEDPNQCLSENPPAETSHG